MRSQEFVAGVIATAVVVDARWPNVQVMHRFNVGSVRASIIVLSDPPKMLRKFLNYQTIRQMLG